jgi:hypothetical protein
MSTRRTTAAQRAQAMKAKATTKAKTSATRLTEADKALDTDVYILNPVTNKHVKRDSAIGQQLIAGETVEKNPTPSEILTNVVRALQDSVGANVLTNAAIKAAISPIAGIPRTFPSEWGGRGKKPRPAGKPKGPKNDYIIFATEMRPQVQKNNPKVPNSAPKGEVSITSIIGELWRKLEDRSEYIQKAKEDRERYETEMEVWERENPEHARVSKGPKKQTRTTGYRVYCDENRAQCKTDNPDVGGREINSKLAKDWGKLTAEQKKPFEDTAAERNKDLPETVRTTRPAGELTEAEQAKANDTENYILNPASGRYVLKKSKAGRDVLRASTSED